MSVLDEFAEYQQQIQEINAVRAQNMSSGGAAAHNQITYNTQRNIAIRRAHDSANDVQQYKTWMQKTFIEQEHRASKIQEIFQKTEYRLNKSLNAVMESMQTITKDVIDTFSPEHLAETSTSQFRAFLYLLGTSTIATNIGKIKGWASKIAEFFGIGENEEGKITFKDVLSKIVTGQTGNSVIDSLTSIVKAPIDYLINWIKGEFELRTTMMKKVKMPELEPVSLGTLGADILPFGNLLQSVSSYLSDVLTSLGQKVSAFFDPSAISTIAGNNEVKSMAEDTRSAKAESFSNEDENGTLYVYGRKGTSVKGNNTVNFIPKTFLNATGGLTGTVGSMLGASRQVYSLYKESKETGRVDTASLVDTLNKMYNTAKRKGYIIVEAAFLNTFPETTIEKYKNSRHEIKIYIVKGSKNVIETIGLGLKRDGKDPSYYLTEDEWNNLTNDSRNKLKILGTVLAYKLTKEEFDEFARSTYSVDSFDSMSNATFVGNAQYSLESVAGQNYNEKSEAKLTKQIGQNRMMVNPDIETVYSDAREAYETAREEAKERLHNSEPAQIFHRVKQLFTKEDETYESPSSEGPDYENLELDPRNLTKDIDWTTKEGKERAEWIRQNSVMLDTILGGKADRLSSYWGSTAGRTHEHKGIDIPTEIGTPVYAPEDGTIQKVNTQNTGAGGKYILLTTLDGQRTYFFCHLDEIIKRQGDRVKRGERIAYTGNTGVGTGPHLHFEVRLNGEKVDPLQYIQAAEGLDYDSRTINPPKEQERPVSMVPEEDDIRYIPMPSSLSSRGYTTRTAIQVAESAQTSNTNNAEINLQKIQTSLEIKKAAIQVIGLAGEELAGKIDVTNQLLGEEKAPSNPVDIRRR